MERRPFLWTAPAKVPGLGHSLKSVLPLCLAELSWTR